jgi:hypothetical protein
VNGAVTGDTVRHKSSAAKARTTRIRGNRRMPWFWVAYQEQRQRPARSPAFLLGKMHVLRANANKTATNLSTARDVSTYLSVYVWA